MEDSDYHFPDCMHAMAASFHRENIDPLQVEIVMPREMWWQLWCAIDRKYRDRLITPVPDGRSDPVSFQYMGFRFVPRREAA